MKSLIDNRIIGTPVSQNKQDFILGVFTIEQFFKFTRYTHRLIVNYNEEGKPEYNNKIQRFVEPPRVEKIADFLTKDPNASFPTNIVLHIPKEVILKQDELESQVIITINEEVFNEINNPAGDVFISIIDGQHRVRGIEVAIQRLESEIDDLSKTLRVRHNMELQDILNFKIERLKDLKNIELVVSFFIDKTLEYQAMIFSTINRTQKRVSQSLVYDLFGLDKNDTPQKIALQIALELNGNKNSPFYKRIKLYGGSYSNENSPPITQATIVRSIINLICENIRESENDRYRKRKDLMKRSVGSAKLLPFRKYYALNKDYMIGDIIYFYFKAVREVFINNDNIPYWDFSIESKKTQNIFHTTVGYDTLLKILVDILSEKEIVNDLKDTKIFIEYLVKAKHLNIGDITKYSFNNRGKRILYLDMNLAIWPPKLGDKNDDRKEQLDNLMMVN